MRHTSPAREGFHQPAEWSPHQACWLAWPSHADLWQEDLGAAQEEFTALCRAIADLDPRGKPRGERLQILVPDEAREAEAADALAGLQARLHRIPFGDIWLRDTAPIFVADEGGDGAAVSLHFNGWGGKYVLPHDDQVSRRVAERSGLPAWRLPWVLEGGSVDVDGEGTALTTRQCLLNPNRNRYLSQRGVEEALREALGVEKVLWLDEGLRNDHTDGHVDTLARFVRPGLVACMEPAPDDPNRDVLERIAAALATLRDAKGRRVHVARVPSPGAVLGEDGRPMPASFMNFYVGNRTVVVPTYGTAHDARAVEAIGSLFPGRRAIGLSARAILTGGGAFHCITQQQPGVLDSTAP